MAVKVAINGFGRIGRLVFRAMVEQGLLGKDVLVVAVGDIVPADNLAYLLKYDSTQGRFQGTVSSKASTTALQKAKAEGKKPEEVEHDVLIVNGQDILLVNARTPEGLPWKSLGVEVVIESTGLYTDADKSEVVKIREQSAYGHIRAGANKVIISAPAKNEDITIVMGVNHDKYDPRAHQVISNASCTTNCLAPVAKVIHEKFGIRTAQMTTIHSYTNDQQLLDLPHKDLRRARAAGLSMIPTSTGAAKAVALVLPELKGKFDGISVRVPTPNVSLVDVVMDVEKETTTDEVNQALKDAANEELNGILAFSEEPLVSSDFKGNPNSSIVDAEYTKVIGGHMIKVLSWYDNEWGYSCRVRDLVKYIAGKGL